MRVDPSDRISAGPAGERTSRRGNRRRARKPNAFKRTLWRLLQFLGLILLTSALAVLVLRWVNPPTTAFLLQDQSTQPQHRLAWEPWPALGMAAPLAVVAAEDQRFAQHAGFDLTSIQKALAEHADGESLRGASTISQQLAKNLFLWPGRSYLRKGLEAYFTVLIEALLPKQRILEIYLNVAEFGPGVFGVRAAGAAYFDKRPAQFEDTDAALLAAVLPNPKQLRADAPSEYVQERRAWIEGQMRRLRQEDWISQLN